MIYECPQCGRQSLTYEPRTSLGRCLYYADCGYSVDAESLEVLLNEIQRRRVDTVVLTSKEEASRSSRIEEAASS